MRLIFSLLLLFLIVTSFIKKTDYEPERIFLRGQLINLNTDIVLKRLEVFIEGGFSSFITNRKGEFSGYTFIDISKPIFWLRTVEFAQIGIYYPEIDTTNIIDTIDLGKIYLVPYDNELEIEAYNMPKSNKRKKKEKYDKISILKIDSILKLRNCSLVMDSVISQNMTSRYQFRKTKTRGTIIKKYKVLKFRKIIN